jgi:hypothetical protein
VEEAMPEADHFRALARRCCVLAKAATAPEVKEQLRLWAVEFADQADDAERRAAAHEEATTTYPTTRARRPRSS